MTTIDTERWSCGACGEVSEQTAVASALRLSPADLDLRPGETEDATMADWVLRCPACGYVADGFAYEAGAERERGADVRALVASEPYRARLGDESCGELANAFRCRALIEADAGSFAAAGWWELRAAWACDDEERAEAARRCRERALWHWHRAEEEEGETIVEDKASTQLLIADVLRRVGAVDPARRRCRRGLSGRPGEPLRSLLEYELELVERGDADAHSIREVGY